MIAPYYATDITTLYHGDCLEVMPLLPDNSIDLIDRECPVCKANYKASATRLKHGRQTTCSRSCSYALRAKKTASKLSGRSKCGTSISIERSTRPCELCGKSFHPRRKSGRFCSKTCSIRSRPNALKNRQCQNCGTEYKPSHKHSKYCTRKCFEFSHKDRMLGGNNPAWQGGRSYSKRCHRGDDWGQQRLRAYERDNYTCQHCGVHCISRRSMTEDNAAQLIQCHHIAFWKDSQNNSLSNLITLCVSCHAKVHFGNIDLHEKGDE